MRLRNQVAIRAGRQGESKSVCGLCIVSFCGWVSRQLVDTKKRKVFSSRLFSKLVFPRHERLVPSDASRARASWTKWFAWGVLHAVHLAR